MGENEVCVNRMWLMAGGMVGAACLLVTLVWWWDKGKTFEDQENVTKMLLIVNTAAGVVLAGIAFFFGAKAGRVKYREMRDDYRAGRDERMRRSRD